MLYSDSTLLGALEARIVTRMLNGALQGQLPGASGGTLPGGGSSWAARDSPRAPARARGHTAAAAAAAVAAMESDAPPDADGVADPGLAEGAGPAPPPQLPPQLCSTLSDLSFNLGDQAWWDSMGGDAAAAFPELDDVFPDDGLAPPVGMRLLRRLSSSFSDWKRLEPPTKKGSMGCAWAP